MLIAPKLTTPKGYKIFGSAEKIIRAEITTLQPRLWRFAYGLCRNHAGADDLCQSTCLRALENAVRFTPGTNADRWLFTICRNLWLNDLRAAKTRLGHGVLPLEENDLPATISSAEANIYASEVLIKVLELPDAQRETVLLVYVEGFSYKEAAAILDIPIGTVMSRLAAARKTLAPLNREEG